MLFDFRYALTLSFLTVTIISIATFALGYFMDPLVANGASVKGISIFIGTFVSYGLTNFLLRY